MGSSLTQLEIDAVCQLIQLSGDYRGDIQIFWVKVPNKIKEEIGEEEESVGETSSSCVIEGENELWDEGLPRRRRKWREIVDIYSKTQPLIKFKRTVRRRPRI